MKRFGKVLGLAVLTAAAAVFMGCPTPNNNNTGGGTDLWETEGIELITSLANKSTGWEDPIEIPSSYAKRLQADSRVIFELSKNTAKNNKGEEYTNLRFNVQDGEWGAVGVKDYYDASGKKLNVTEDTDNPGVYNTDNIEDGTYYFDVKATNLDKLKAGFAFGGNLKVVRLGITNLAAKQDTDPNAAVYSGDEIVLNVTADSVLDTDSSKYKTKLRLQYFRENNKKQKITFSNLDLSVTIGDDVIAMNDEYSFELNEYGKQNADGKFSEYDLDLPLDKELKTSDTVKVQVKQTNITGDDDITDDIIASIKIFIFDNAKDAGNGYYKELSGSESLITKKNGEKFTVEPDPDEPRPEIGEEVYKATGEGLKITLDLNKYSSKEGESEDTIQGLQFADDGSKYLPKGAKADEEYTIVMKGTASADVTANVQFLTWDDWSGLGAEGSDISAEFTAEFNITNAFTFNSDSNGKFRFAIGNNDKTANEIVTLTLTEFTITRTK